MSFDRSDLDKRYFIDGHVYNCPFCKRRNVKYELIENTAFDWNNDRKCAVYLVQCSSCTKISMHLSYKNLRRNTGLTDMYKRAIFEGLDGDLDLDAEMIFHQPPSFFAVDARIPKKLRDHIMEGEHALNMNMLTSASACIRKAVYEMLVSHSAVGDSYESKVKSLKNVFPGIDPTYFDDLAASVAVASNRVHELSWEKFDGAHCRLLLETVKTVVLEMYVVPEERKARSSALQGLRKKMAEDENQARTSASDSSRKVKPQR